MSWRTYSHANIALGRCFSHTVLHCDHEQELKIHRRAIKFATRVDLYIILLNNTY